MKSFILVLLFTFIFVAELRIVDDNKSNTSSQISTVKKKRFKKMFLNHESWSKGKYRNKIFGNNAVIIEDISNRIKRMINSSNFKNVNRSNIFHNFVNNPLGETKRNEFVEKSKIISGSIEVNNTKGVNERYVRNEKKNEIMDTAEVYFRPMSRYRELQEKKEKSYVPK